LFSFLSSDVGFDFFSFANAAPPHANAAATTIAAKRLVLIMTLLRRPIAVSL
jgi:hypothetical protein